MNHSNAPIVSIQARNVETNAVLHSHLFRLVFPKVRFFISFSLLSRTQNASSLVFNTCVLNSPKLRTFCITSACNSPLELHLSTSLPSMLRLYVENTAQVLRPSVQRAEAFPVQPVSTVGRAEYLDLAFPRRAVSLSVKRPLSGDLAAPSPVPSMEEKLHTLKELEEGLGLLLDHPIPVAQELEDSAVTRTHEVLRDLERYLSEGRLVPLERFVYANRRDFQFSILTSI